MENILPIVIMILCIGLINEVANYYKDVRRK